MVKRTLGIYREPIVKLNLFHGVVNRDIAAVLVPNINSGYLIASKGLLCAALDLVVYQAIPVADFLLIKSSAFSYSSRFLPLTPLVLWRYIMRPL